jgi:hypothetical protein
MAMPWKDWTCNKCRKTNADLSSNESPIEERYSLGIFAGRWCDPCWEASGYRKEGREGFDPSYAGEHYDEEDY